MTGLKDIFAERYAASTDTGAHADVGQSWQSDAIDALVALGYPQSDARKVINTAPDTINSVNDAVKHALTQLGQS